MAKKNSELKMKFE